VAYRPIARESGAVGGVASIVLMRSVVLLYVSETMAVKKRSMLTFATYEFERRCVLCNHYLYVSMKLGSTCRSVLPSPIAATTRDIMSANVW
jgi:hypothetical protein